MDRFYTVDEKIELPSVTSILSIQSKPGLMMWRGRVGNEEADRVAKTSSDLGTRVHEAIAHYLKTGATPVSMGDDVADRYESFLEWMRKRQFSALQFKVEYKVYSLRYGYAGTIDAFHVPTKTIFDWKTSKDARPEWAMQTVAYMVAHNERFPNEFCRNRESVRFREGGKKALDKSYQDSANDMVGFVSALELWKSDRNRIYLAKETV